jgi:large subunit ribosomal protein L9
MKVLLLQDVDNLGLAGNIVKVANGYGRNYLIPQQLAVLATAGAIKQAESVRKAGELRRAREKGEAEAIAGQIEGTLLVFHRRAGDQDKLYGSVTANDIAQGLNEKFGFEIDKRKIALPEPIRVLGEWDVSVKLMIEVSASVHVVVIKEGQVYQPQSKTEAVADSPLPEAEATPEAEAQLEPAEAAV